MNNYSAAIVGVDDLPVDCHNVTPLIGGKPSLALYGYGRR
jgi:hypothetical protein